MLILLFDLGLQIWSQPVGASFITPGEEDRKAV